MRCNKKNWIVSFCVFGLALCCGWSSGQAEEDPPPAQAAGAANDAEQEEQAVYFETEGDFFLGYRWFSSEDSLKAAEYVYPHSSLTFGLDLLSCPLPYRYHVNAEFVSRYDYYADAGFAYKDTVLFRDILVGVHHNLNHFSYQFAGEPPDLIYTERNTAEDYYVDFVSNLASLRLKTPNFPFHTFVNHRYVERDGREQQRFLLGDFELLNKVSESRDIDWRSNAVKLGANSHLGPIEIEYAYDEADFDPGQNNILFDIYPASDAFSRPGDIYPHNVVPETESSAHSVKMHSSYTGGIVAAAGISNLSQKNNYSHTESTTWKGAFDFSWIPAPVVGFFFKYRHKDVDMDNPAEVTLTGLNNAINYEVRQGISYDKDVFSLSTRYKPGRRVSLFANYEFSHLSRSDIAEWAVLPDETDIHTIDLTAQARPLDRLKVTAKYEFKDYDNPPYNSTPDNSNTLRLTTTYSLSPSLNVYLEYILALTDRDSLHYLNPDPAVLVETGERDGQRDQLLASLSAALTPKLSVTASWFYLRWEIDQDLAYGKWLMEDAGDLPFIDPGVPYTDTANSFSLALHYLPREDLSLAADVTHTITEGTTDYHDVVGDAPFSLATFSNLEVEETSFSLAIVKKFTKDWEVGLKSYLNIYNDKVPDLLDGKAYINTIIAKRYF